MTWPKFEELPQWHESKSQSIPYRDYVGKEALLSPAFYERARLAIARQEAGERLAEAAKWALSYLIQPPKRGLVAAARAELDKALAAWEAGNRG